MEEIQTLTDQEQWIEDAKQRNAETIGLLRGMLAADEAEPVEGEVARRVVTQLGKMLADEERVAAWLGELRFV